MSVLSAFFAAGRFIVTITTFPSPVTAHSRVPMGSRLTTARGRPARANQLVHALRDRGLRPGDGIAGLRPNGVGALEIYVAARQAGWYFTPINWHYTPPEIAYIVRDCGAKALIADSRFAAHAVQAAAEAQLPPAARFSHGEAPGFLPVARLPAGHPASMPDDPTADATMYYTSATTARPKGVRRALPPLDPDDTREPMRVLLQVFAITAGPPTPHLPTPPHSPPARPHSPP